MTESPYTVQPGDTLSAIAAHHHTTVAELVKLNHLSNPNALSVGQRLQLVSPSAAASASPAYQIIPVFVDILRHPIEGLSYRATCGTTTVSGISKANGAGDPVTVAHPGLAVTLSAQIGWLNHRWEQLATVKSGPTASKVVTLVSPMLNIKWALAEHPKDAFGQPKVETPASQPIATKSRGSVSQGKGKPVGEVAKGSGKGLHGRAEQDPNGITRVVLSRDLPDLKDCFAAYTGERITETDWKEAALRLKCDPAVLKAIPAVETSGIGGFFPDSGTPPIPTILYERTWFHRKTSGQYDATNADLSMPPPKVLRALKASKDKDDQEEYARLQAVRMYPRRDHNGTANYRRFVNACLLDKSAAIQSCSWGKFQIMGFNWQACGFDSLLSFLKAAFTSERAQFGMYTGFIQHNQSGALREAVIAKDWVRIAEIYNGRAEAKTPAWWKKQHPQKPWVPYHVKLKEAYDRLKTTA